ncbi:MAG TPA: cation:proton antiporter family protein [Dermatophilaceae bacterium]|nr:cation:proton antiporter family protein [Dermatophilaceae bacterium]
MSPGEFYLFAAILGMAAVAGLIANKLRQPVIVAFVAIGIAVGPVGTGWVVANDQVELLSRLGIAMLLFLVGLKLDVHLIRSTGPVALATGLGQVFFTSVVGFMLALVLGLDRTAALYVAVALTFSSTVIIVKLLSDKRELDELHGRIAVGFLIVQDIVVIMVMIGLTAFANGSADGFGPQAVLVLGKGLGLLAGIAVVARYLLPSLLRRAAHSRELLVLLSVALAVGVASISDWLGFGTEIGAFLAGVSLASTPYREAVGARLVSLRDFLLLFFFLDLGARLEFTDAGDQVLAAAVLSLFVLIGNPLIVIIIMGAMRYPVRVSFLAGLTVAQISEFSLILAALGLSLGHIDNSTVGLITIIGLVTISLSTYLILYSHKIYNRLAPVLSVFERRATRRLPDDGLLTHDVEVILYGLGRYGSEIVDRLRASDCAVLAVDFDPHATAQWKTAGIETIFGDAEDLDLLESLPLDTARWVISTILAADVNLALLHGLRHSRFRGRIALTAHNRHDVDRLRASGADVVLEPFSIAAQRVVDEVVHAKDLRDGPHAVG